jgi:hypothetical protein
VQKGKGLGERGEEAKELVGRELRAGTGAMFTGKYSIISTVCQVGNGKWFGWRGMGEEKKELNAKTQRARRERKNKSQKPQA